MGCQRCAVLEKQNQLLTQTVVSLKADMKDSKELSDILDSIHELSLLVTAIEKTLDDPKTCPCKTCTDQRGQLR